MTYGQLATMIENPGALRAVGTALGKNPLMILVPCHRVLAAGGALGGFSAPGGTNTKRRLLRAEGVLDSQVEFERLAVKKIDVSIRLAVGRAAECAPGAAASLIISPDDFARPTRATMRSGSRRL